MTTDEPLPLPGLEPERRSAVGAVEQAARRTIAALHDHDLIDERHALACQTMLVLAAQLDRAAQSDRAKDYGVAAVAAQLREMHALLMPDATGEGEQDDAWTQLAHDLRDAASRHAT